MPDPNLALARERIGRVLKDRWVLDDVIGVGGMAAVYAARHRNGAKAAIKLLHGPLVEDHTVRERFLREAYLANSLEHPGTVHVLDDDADPQLGPFLVMELLDGSSILELLDKGVAFGVPEVLDIADQTLDVLAAAHDRGIVHRDLKPANLFLCRTGAVKVLDFGIARVVEANAARLTRTGVPLGTPAYMAPEQARGQGRDADGRADLYSLGATLFRMLAGRHVHTGRGAEQIAKVATQRAPKLHEAAPQLPPIVCAVVDRAIEFEPERRYRNAREMQADVRALEEGRQPPVASHPLPPPGAVPALPPLQPRKRKDSTSGEHGRRDEHAELAESLRQRAHQMARRPDAFTHTPGEDEGYEEEEEENMPTLVGSPQHMLLGPKPTSLADANRPRPRVPVPRRNPAQTQQRAAAQLFARIPNVPVPMGAGPAARAPVSDRYDDDNMPTLARTDIALAPSPLRSPQHIPVQPDPSRGYPGAAAQPPAPPSLASTQYAYAPGSGPASRPMPPISQPVITHAPSSPHGPPSSGPASSGSQNLHIPVHEAMQHRLSSAAMLQGPASQGPASQPFGAPYSAPSIPPAPPRPQVPVQSLPPMTPAPEAQRPKSNALVVVMVLLLAVLFGAGAVVLYMLRR